MKDVAGSVVREAADVVSREAEREGLTPQRLSRKLRRVAGHVRDAVLDVTASQ